MHSKQGCIIFVWTTFRLPEIKHVTPTGTARVWKTRNEQIECELWCRACGKHHSE